MAGRSGGGGDGGDEECDQEPVSTLCIRRRRPCLEF